MNNRQVATKTQVSTTVGRDSYQRGSTMNGSVPSTSKGQSFEEKVIKELAEHREIIRKQGERIDRLERERVSIHNAPIEKGVSFNEIEIYCPGLVKSSGSRFSGTLNSVSDALDDLRSRLNIVEEYIKTKLNLKIEQIYSVIGSVEKCLREEWANFEMKINEKLKQVQEFFRQNDFQAKEKLQLSSLVQQPIFKKETRVESRGASSNKNLMNLTPQSFTKKKILCVYSDKGLYTDSTLKKLESDLLKENQVECLNISNLDDHRTKTPDKLFFFYFLTNGREQARTINDVASRMAMMWPGKSMYLIILKDAKCERICMDLQKVSFASERIKIYQLFSLEFAKFVLYIDKPTKSINGVQLKQIKQNYESLVQDMKTIISQGENY